MGRASTTSWLCGTFADVAASLALLRAFEAARHPAGTLLHLSRDASRDDRASLEAGGLRLLQRRRGVWVRGLADAVEVAEASSRLAWLERLEGLRPELYASSIDAYLRRGRHLVLTPLEDTGPRRMRTVRLFLEHGIDRVRIVDIGIDGHEGLEGGDAR